MHFQTKYQSQNSPSNFS